ncbi:MAG: lipocalin family protein [bacterium]
MNTFLTLSSCTLLILSGCSFFGSTTHPPLDAVPTVDLNKYLGKWYEIASLPVFAQKGCSCTSAEYSLREDGTIKVINQCRKDSTRGDVDQIEGNNIAKLKYTDHSCPD